MRHGWSAQHTSQHSTSDLRVARTRSARRPGSDARAAAALYATFASAILALCRARRGTRFVEAEALRRELHGPRAPAREAENRTGQPPLDRWTSELALRSGAQEHPLNAQLANHN